MSYATTEQLATRWRTLTETEEATATVKLADASVMLDALGDMSDQPASLLELVVCNMVSRAMSTDSDVMGVTGVSQAAGVYSQSLTYGNPAGDMYVSKLEKKMLKLSTSKIGSIEPTQHYTAGLWSEWYPC